MSQMQTSIEATERLRDRAPLAVIEGIPYGRGKTERFDLYALDWRRQRKPIIVLIPGMWQQARERRPYSALARALIEDGAVVAVVEYSPVSVSWPQQLFDLRRALAQISTEAAVLGGDTQNTILFGDGLGAFLAAQLVFTQQQFHWLPDSQARIAAWVGIDGIWSEENLQALPEKHPLRLLFPDAASWDSVRPLTMLQENMPPAFLVHLPPASLEMAEQFVVRSLSKGNELSFLTRPENPSRIWRGIAKHDHPLRVSLRPWLHRFRV